MIKRSFIGGALSLNEKDLQENLAHFKVPEVDIESIRSKPTLAFKIFDEYANIPKSMYSPRFNGCPKDSNVYAQTDSGPMSPLITSLQVWQSNNIRLPKEKEKKGDG